jgi:RNA polymerase sigma-70 factor (ECF subfamily)
MTEDEKDVRLAVEAQGGNRDSGDELCRKYENRVLAWTGKRLFWRGNWRDVGEDALAHVFEKLNLFVPGRGRFSSWAYRVVQTFVWMELRKRMHRPQLESLDSTQEETLVARGGPEQDQSAREIRAAVAELPPNQSVVVDLHVFQGFNLTEVAGMLATTLRVVRYRYKLARRSLAAKLSGFVGKEPCRFSPARA